LVAGKLLGNIKKGFYVDVGCHDPRRFSNTYFFYLRGWAGLCIDPLPGTKKKFNAIRPRDAVLEVGISSSPGKLTYFMFNEPALNTFDEALANKRVCERYWIEREIKVETKALGEILDVALVPPNFELLSIDIEGYDLVALESINWTYFRPRVIIAEAYSEADGGVSIGNLMSHPIVCFLSDKGYSLYGKTGNSVIFTPSADLV
jgi:FkbM family methyltransferase